MIDKHKKLVIPIDEKLYIMPDVRAKLFSKLLQDYAKYYPKYKLIYGVLNNKATATMAVDFMLIFEYKVGNNNVILIEAPFQYSDRTIPGYRYCLREGLIQDYFEEAGELMVRMPAYRFYEFLNLRLDLSDNPESEDYWKREEHAEKLTEGMVDLSVRFVRK